MQALEHMPGVSAECIDVAMDSVGWKYITAAGISLGFRVPVGLPDL